MSAKYGYIGYGPDTSSVVVAKQVFSPTGVQTNFTFAAGYQIGYLDVYLNGARQIEGQDFSATDTSTVGLSTAAQSGDVLELVAYKAYNLAAPSAVGNFTVSGNLDVTGNESVSTLVATTAIGIRTTNPIQPFQVGFGTNIVVIDNMGDLGIGTTNPTARLNLYDTAGSAAWRFKIGTNVSDGAGFYQRANGDFEMVLRDASNNNNYILGSSGNLSLRPTSNVLINTDTPTGTGNQRLQVNSGAYVSGSVGIGTTNPTSTLTVVGDGRFSGVVTATSFVGSGSNLTGIGVSGALLGGPQVLTSGTSYTTPASCTKIYVECVGGGGGGGGAGAPQSFAGNGGGSGAYVASYLTVSSSTSYTYAIGVGGTGGAAGGGSPGSGGTSGGTTRFTVGITTLTAGGGAGGPANGNGAGGVGGSASGGTLNANGSGGISAESASSGLAGAGGASFFGGGGAGGYSPSTGGNGSCGGGGGGGRSNSGPGGNGGAGLIRIFEYS